MLMPIRENKKQAKKQKTHPEAHIFLPREGSEQLLGSGGSELPNSKKRCWGWKATGWLHRELQGCLPGGMPPMSGGLSGDAAAFEGP